MKKFKRVLVWASLSIIIQCAGLFYINNYFLSDNTNITIQKITNSNNKKDAEVSIPKGATNVNVSYNGRYISYYDKEVLKVINTKTGEEKSVEFNSGVKVSYYTWMPDRNRMLIAEKKASGSSNKFELAYYDVDKDAKDKITDLTWADKKAEVSQIQASPLTNVINIKISLSGNRNSIYWINIMKEMKKVDTKAYVIGNIRMIPHEDKLVYEDLTYNKVFVTGQEAPLTIPGVTRLCLVATDYNDNIYLGNDVNGKVTKIYYRGSNSKESFNELAIGGEVDKSDIYVSNSGKIYVNDNFKGVVKELSTGKEFSYSGTFVQIFEGGIVSLSENKVVKTFFN